MFKPMRFIPQFVRKNYNLLLSKRVTIDIEIYPFLCLNRHSIFKNFLLELLQHERDHHLQNTTPQILREDKSPHFDNYTSKLNKSERLILRA
jgi:hypothetical protein